MNSPYTIVIHRTVAEYTRTGGIVNIHTHTHTIYVCVCVCVYVCVYERCLLWLLCTVVVCAL